MTAPWGVRLSPIPAPFDRSPWGDVEEAHEHAPGVVFVSTPSHGGFLVDAAAAATMPAGLRALGAPFGALLAFEEDCAYCAVVVAFPALFAPASADHAARVLRADYPRHVYGLEGCGRSTPAGSFHRCGS